MRRYRALLVGNWHYPDDPANLPDLKGPLNDVSRLAEALADPAIGLFTPADVTTLTERASHEIVAELEAFFGDATREDVLLLYFSGHGITADNGALLLCGRNARTDRKLATTVSSETVNQMIRACPAAAVVIMLDCCHAGAFKSGDLAGELAGRGRFVLTASRSRDRAPDAEHSTGLSRFTGHVVRGIRGEASLTGADHITLSDLYRYVHRRMTEDGPTIPQRRFDGDGEVAIARAVAAPRSLVATPDQIDVGEVRLGEVLPVERVRVTATASDGSPCGWWAETEADWVFTQVRGEHLDVRITPRAGGTRANIHVHNQATREVQTIRVFARPVEALATPVARTAPVLSQPQVDVERSAWAPMSTAGLGALAASRGADAPALLAAVALQALTAVPVDGLQRQPALASRAEKVARKTLGVADTERSLGTLDLEGDGFILLTDRAFYWTNQRQVAAVPYAQFPQRGFAVTSSASHLDLGDGVPRLVGRRAPAVVALLTAIRDALG
jgi:hypothetical protein